MFRIFRHYVSGLALVLFLGDLLVLLGAFYVTELSTSWPGYGPFAARFLEVAGVVALMLYLADLYHPRQALARRELIARVLVSQAGAALAIAAIGFAGPLLRLARPAPLEIVGLGTLGLIVSRAGLLAGGAATSARSFSIIGFLDDAPGAADMVPDGYSLLGKIQDLGSLVEETRPDIVVIAQMDRRGCFPTKELLECRLRGIRVED